MGVPLFLLRPAEKPRARRRLRRLVLASDCPDGGSHRAAVPIEEDFLVLDAEGHISVIDTAAFADDPRWPTQCGCGYVFTDDDYREVAQDPIYAAEDGREFTISEAPPGAVWEAPWMGREHWGVNDGGPVWVIRLPNGLDFVPGSTANNCDRKDEDHDCWCVHGEPPGLTIDKNPEPGRSTCTAGAGSIFSAAGSDRAWHGFVTNGELVEV